MRQLRREADGAVQALERVPVDFDADELPFGRPLGFARERRLADEMLLAQVDRPGEVELVGRRGLALDERLARRHVVDVEQHEPRFDARNVEREHAGRR